MQPYDYKLFSVIPLDSDFESSFALVVLRSVYSNEISILSDFLKQYKKKELQDIFDECISYVDLKEFNKDGSTSRLGYKVLYSYINELKDKNKEMLCYFIFAWYELESLSIFIDKVWNNTDMETSSKKYLQAFYKWDTLMNYYFKSHDFMMLFCRIMILDSNKMNFDYFSNGLKTGFETQKKIHSHKMSENGKKSSSRKNKFITELDIIRKELLSNDIKSYESKIKHIESRHKVCRNTAAKWYSNYIKNQSVQDKIDTVKQIPANKD